MVRAIVGFRIKVTRIDVKLKLSQNRSRDDRERVIDGLARKATPRRARRRHGCARSRWTRDAGIPGNRASAQRARVAQQRRNADRSRMRSGLWYPRQTA
jgi:hypothetical protein